MTTATHTYNARAPISYLIGLALLAASCSAEEVKDCSVRWQLEARGPILVTPVIVDKLVIWLDSDKSAASGVLTACDLQTGHVIWKRSLPDGKARARASLVAAEGAVCLVCENGDVCVLDVVDGSMKWWGHRCGYTWTTPCVTANHLIVADRDEVYCIRLQTGEYQWSKKVPGGLSLVANLSTDGQTLFVAGSKAGLLYTSLTRDDPFVAVEGTHEVTM